MAEVIPTAEPAEVVLVLLFKSVGINMVVLFKRTVGHGGTLHTFLLKKSRTPWSNTFPRQQDLKDGRSSRRPCDLAIDGDGCEAKTGSADFSGWWQWTIMNKVLPVYT